MITVSLTMEEAQAVTEAIRHGRETNWNIRYQNALRTANTKLTTAIDRDTVTKVV